MDGQPIKKVFSPSDIEKWEKSEAYQDVMGFLMAMNDAVKGKKLSAECCKSEVVKSLHHLFEKLSLWIDEIPPIDQPQRYGNKAFKTYYEKVSQNINSLLENCLPQKYHQYVSEISVYFIESLGNSTRIDYGTGHELSFIMLLCCLHKIEVLKTEDSIATVTVLFKDYLDLARKLQKVYKMEPAGSQGVWSLDDYQFVPFIWGSSQLIMNPKISPDMFTQESVVEEFASEYLFLSSIQYILSVKTGPFAEHSNQLWNISGVKTWTKINQGLFKMYKAELLNKFPVIQHVLFGSILKFDAAKKIYFQPAPNMGALKSSVGIMATRSDLHSSRMGAMHSLLDGRKPPSIDGGFPPNVEDRMPPNLEGRMPPETAFMMKTPTKPTHDNQLDESLQADKTECRSSDCGVK